MSASAASLSQKSSSCDGRTATSNPAPARGRREVTMNPVPAFPSVADAMAAVQAGLRFVANTDATTMSGQAQAECLQMMERANAIVTAARASVLSAFTSAQGYSAGADYSPRAWLIHKTRVTKVVAVAHTAWAKRTVTHSRVMAALAAEDLSESYG